MSEKKFFFKAIAYSLGILIAIALLVVIIDPFVHYHAPFFNLAVTETDERSQQIGVAKNCDFDTALIGSSMSENFTASWFNDGIIGNKTVKLCMQGSHFDDLSRLLKASLAKESTKTIVYSLDNYVILNVPEDYPTTIPEYLENDKLSDDVYYLWNKSVALYYLPSFLINNVRDNFSSDRAYNWAGNFVFSKEAAISSYLPARLESTADEEVFNTYYPYAFKFVDGITPFIRENPDVEFIFYVPPYSVLYWDDSIRHGRLTAEICALNEVYSALLSYPNVRLFYFQDDWDVITNLDNYKDYSHYKEDINRYMYECMANGSREVFMDTYYDKLLNFSEEIVKYNFDEIFN